MPACTVASVRDQLSARLRYYAQRPRVWSELRPVRKVVGGITIAQTVKRLRELETGPRRALPQATNDTPLGWMAGNVHTLGATGLSWMRDWWGDGHELVVHKNGSPLIRLNVVEERGRLFTWIED